MVDKEKMLRQIKELLEKCVKLIDEGKLTKYKEESTKQDFIVPLFHRPGWNMEESNEVSKEENVSKGRVDYGFKINGIPKFYLAECLRI
nr:hypothetical protein [Candidatus Njordarchaeota archaeon]